jgi:hypothetical protein
MSKKADALLSLTYNDKKTNPSSDLLRCPSTGNRAPLQNRNLSARNAQFRNKRADSPSGSVAVTMLFHDSTNCSFLQITGQRGLEDKPIAFSHA